MDFARRYDPHEGLPSSVNIVVVGDKGSGKTSLISTAVTGRFTEDVPSVLEPKEHCSYDFPYNDVPITIVDTSSSQECQDMLPPECKDADAIVLTVSYECLQNGDSLRTKWLPKLRELRVSVVLVACKLDLLVKEDSPIVVEDWAPTLTSLCQDYPEITSCSNCTALHNFSVQGVFHDAQVAAIHPIIALYDYAARELRPRCKNALKRVFILSDKNKDGVLCADDLNALQYRCFHTSLLLSELVQFEVYMRNNFPSGLNSGLRLNLAGFQHLHELHITTRRHRTTWAVLRSFGYGNDVRLKDDVVPSIVRDPDQSVELTDVAVDFLKECFFALDADKHDVLQMDQIKDLFSTAPECPWVEGPFDNAVEEDALGGLTLRGFLSKWAIMTLQQPRRSLAFLIYILYPYDINSAFRVTRRRWLDLVEGGSERSVFHFFVFGPRRSGKSALLNSLVKRPYSSDYCPTTSERFAVNIFELPGGTAKTLVLHEVPEERVESLLLDRRSLAACDVGLFLFDSSDVDSSRDAIQLLERVLFHRKQIGFVFPSCLVAVQIDWGPSVQASEECKQACRRLGLETPIPVSLPLHYGDLGDLFQRIIEAARKTLSIIVNRRKLISFLCCGLVDLFESAR